MVGWQLCRGPAVINVSDIEFIRSLGTPQADFALDCNSTAMQSLERQTGELGISLPDPVAMGILLDGSLSPYSTRHLVAVETESELTRGMTVVDRLNVVSDTRNHEVWRPALENNHPVKICWRFNVAHWKNLLFSSLR